MSVNGSALCALFPIAFRFNVLRFDVRTSLECLKHVAGIKLLCEVALKSRLKRFEVVWFILCFVLLSDCEEESS